MAPALTASLALVVDPSGLVRAMLEASLLPGVVLTAGATIALFGVMGCVLTVVAYRTVTHPPPGEFDAPRLGDHLPREEVRFASYDGTMLAAWFIRGARARTILLLHGYTACKNDMLTHAAFLHDAGYSLLLLDLRACGDSGGSAVTLGGKERDDVQAAIGYLLTRADVAPGGIGVLGLSLGGALAILAACDAPVVRAVVAESAFRSLHSVVRHNFREFTHLPAVPWADLTTRLTEWRHKVRASRVAPEREIDKLQGCALLLIHAEDDHIVPVSHADALFERAPEPKELWRLPSAPHAMGYLAVGQEYADRVSAFFDQWLPCASRSERG
ncbi:MAG: alpha/beta hydrolase [Chloroflexi bacterium]|nr:alpha/beta hydrolase [Chloroflexota bacterium]